jgi:signal peptidase I
MTLHSPCMMWKRFLRVEVAETSMSPALLPGDYLVGSRTKPQVGDVVLVNRPDRLLVKRLIGQPGDVIALAPNEPSELQADEYFVVSDNPLVATVDSRQFGPVSLRDIIGTVRFRYWPLLRVGRVASSLPE